MKFPKSSDIHIKSLRQKKLRPSCLYCKIFEIILGSPLSNRISHQRNDIIRKSCALKFTKLNFFRDVISLTTGSSWLQGAAEIFFCTKQTTLRGVIVVKLITYLKKLSFAKLEGRNFYGWYHFFDGPSYCCSINKRGEAFFAEGFLYGYHCFFAISVSEKYIFCNCFFAISISEKYIFCMPKLNFAKSKLKV